MRKPHGFSQIFCDWSSLSTGTDEYGRTVPKECDTFQCGHCSKTVFVPPKSAPEAMGGLCYVCSNLICPDCSKSGKCDPLEAKLERIEKTGDFRRWYSEAAD